ncbi:MAG: amidohydrolase family protein [Ilumatobacteraceae bacterium]|nr:amidohydrolase family protein [Ilumatobacteraceae bacterium]MBJ7422562.1 amidohydrolase family protein [Ilumatobacteraceae bacterium]
MRALLISGGNVIDGTGSQPQPNTDVLIEGDRIIGVGPNLVVDKSQQADLQRIDATGLTVMPGLIDAHTHITLGEPRTNDELFLHRDPATSAILAAYNVRKVLRAGVTSMLDVDGIFNIGPALRDSINAGIVEGPTMKSGAYALMTSVGGTAGKLIPDSGTAGYAEVVRNKEETVLAVRRQVKEGADCIKIHVTGLIPTRSGEIQVWTREELKVVCDTAHDLGVRVTAHCRGDKATLDSVMAGVDIIWHASFLGDASLEAIIDKKVPVGPVFTFLANLSEFGHKAGATSSAKSIFAGELENTGAKLRQAYDAGVKLLCGSESGFSMTPYGHWHAREMEVFVKHLGMTPLQAITCGTKDNAVALDQDGETGCIATGYRADVLVLDGDPSKDISLLGNKNLFRYLYCRGKQVDLSPVEPRTMLRGEQSSGWSDVALTREIAYSN